MRMHVFLSLGILHGWWSQPGQDILLQCSLRIQAGHPIWSRG